MPSSPCVLGPKQGSRCRAGPAKEAVLPSIFAATEITTEACPLYCLNGVGDIFHLGPTLHSWVEPILVKHVTLF